MSSASCLGASPSRLDAASQSFFFFKYIYYCYCSAVGHMGLSSLYWSSVLLSASIKSVVFVVWVSPRVPCLPPAVGLGRKKKTSVRKGHAKDSLVNGTLCRAAEDAELLPPT